ncbi:hypothetical protein MUG84_04660 [Paenibacillus sp. KQZ6P-2]|uniref:Uncharacterized protein n=1 Tax=Paenibacillus mangrovi TaxID=2931978 RepID=A0A9X1WLE1_9BACL|nr:hypothetical protein [Paenibacillus mangrovi]MCJ8011034.1 hypothetical protein [Paenibacillus mangrovi]
MSDNRQVPLLEDWAAYIRGELSPERAEWMESLLLEDEQAFAIYMQALDMEAQGLPVLEDPEHFVEHVMNQLETSHTSMVHLEPKGSRPRWYEHRLFHYVVAASLTLVFLSAGWFDKLTPEPQKADTHMNKSSYSEELVKVTTDWLDKMKP